MTARASRLQTVVGVGLLLIGLGLYGLHVYHGGPFDWHAKSALGIAGVGLLLLPFDFSNVREVAVASGKRVSGMFKATGGDSPPSGGS